MAADKRPARLRCLILRDDAQLANLVAEEQITPHDAEAVREFARYLAKLGKRDPESGD